MSALRGRSRTFSPRRASPGEAGIAGLFALLAPMWLLALRQSTCELLTIGGVAPDVVVLGVAVVAWTRPPFAAVLFATLMGCLVDASSALPWGLTAARLGFLAAAFASLRQGMATEIPGTSALMVAVFVFVERFTHGLVLHTWIPSLELGIALPRLLGCGLLTAFLAPLGLLVASTLEGER